MMTCAFLMGILRENIGFIKKCSIKIIFQNIGNVLISIFASGTNDSLMKQAIKL